MKLLTQGMFTARNLLVTVITTTLFVGCGGDSGGGSSSSTPTAPGISASGQMTINERSTHILPVYSTSSDDTETIVNLEHVSGPVLNVKNTGVVGNKTSFSITAPRTTQDEVSVYKATSHVLGDPSLKSESQIKFDISDLNPRDMSTSRFALGKNYDMESVIGAGVDMEFEEIKQNRCIYQYETRVVPHSKGSTFIQEQLVDLDTLLEHIDIKGDLSVVEILNLGDIEYTRTKLERTGQIQLLYKVTLYKDLTKVIAPHGEKVMALKPTYYDLLTENFLDFRLRCGTGYVAEVYTGAEIYIAINLGFSSRALKEQIKLEGGVDFGSLLTAQATLEYLRQKYSQDIDMKISATVKGGDAELIFGALAGSNLMNCTTSISNCLQALNSINDSLANNSAYFNSISTNPAVIETVEFPYQNAVNVPADYNDVILTQDEIQAAKDIAKLYVQDLSYLNYASRISRSKVNEAQFEEHQSVIEKFESDHDSSTARLALISDANTRCSENQIGCDRVLSDLLLDLGSYSLYEPDMPWILNSKILNTQPAVDVFCLAEGWEKTVITGVGWDKDAYQFYEHYPMAMRVRTINDDKSLGDERYIICQGGNGWKGSSVPASVSNTGSEMVIEPGEIDLVSMAHQVEIEQEPVQTSTEPKDMVKAEISGTGQMKVIHPYDYHWLVPESDDYVLVEFKEGTNFRERMEWFGAVFKKYDDGEIVTHWSDKKAKFYNKDVDYNSVGTKQTVTAPHGGWIVGLGTSRALRHVQPIVAYTLKPY